VIVGHENLSHERNVRSDGLCGFEIMARAIMKYNNNVRTSAAIVFKEKFEYRPRFPVPEEN
jgi:hypothetical protein